MIQKYTKNLGKNKTIIKFCAIADISFPSSTEFKYIKVKVYKVLTPVNFNCPGN